MIMSEREKKRLYKQSLKEFMAEVKILNKYLAYMDMKVVESQEDPDYYVLVHFNKKSVFFSEPYYNPKDRRRSEKREVIGYCCEENSVRIGYNIDNLKYFWEAFANDIKKMVDKIEILEAISQNSVKENSNKRRM